MDNFSYYPDGIIMKDGKVTDQKPEQNSAPQNNGNMFGDLFSNKSIAEILPLLLGKANFNKNDMLAQLSGLNQNEMIAQLLTNNKKEEKKKNMTPQTYLDEP